MIAKIRRAGGVNAVLWYQGCTDAHGEEALSYGEAFASLVQYTRRELGWEIPFYTFQLDKYNAQHDSDGWDDVRQAQRMAAKNLNKVFILPTADLPLSDEIHLSSFSNAALGVRLAKQMDEGIGAPDLERCEKCGEKSLRLVFSNVRGELMKADSSVDSKYFEVCDITGTVPIEEIKTAGNAVILSLSRALNGDAQVSYEKESMRSAGAIKDSLTLNPVIPFLNEKVF